MPHCLQQIALLARQHGQPANGWLSPLCFLGCFCLQEFLIGLEKMVMEEYCEDEEVRGCVCVRGWVGAGCKHARSEAEAKDCVCHSGWWSEGVGVEEHCEDEEVRG